MFACFQLQKALVFVLVLDNCKTVFHNAVQDQNASCDFIFECTLSAFFVYYRSYPQNPNDSHKPPNCQKYLAEAVAYISPRCRSVATGLEKNRMNYLGATVPTVVDKPIVLNSSRTVGDRLCNVRDLVCIRKIGLRFFFRAWSCGLIVF